MVVGRALLSMSGSGQSLLNRDEARSIFDPAVDFFDAYLNPDYTYLTAQSCGLICLRQLIGVTEISQFRDAS